MNKALKKIGQEIKEARLKAKLSPRGLQNKIDVSYVTISNIEDGKANPTFEKLSIICEYLGIKFLRQDLDK